MTSWMKERDRLLAQTLAFVQGVNAKRPITVAAPDPVSQSMPATISPEAPAEAPAAAPVAVNRASAETDDLMSLMAHSTPGKVATPAQPATAADILPQPVRLPAQTPVYQPAARRLVEVVVPERELIAKHVARFRASQQKTLQDREVNYAAVQAKIRATLGNDPFA